MPAWLPTLSVYALREWLIFWTFASAHEAIYRLTFFLVQLSLLCGVVAFLSRKYSSAIWVPQPSWCRGFVVSLLILLPLLLFHLSGFARGVRGIIGLWTFGAEGIETLNSIYYQVWNRLAYGSSLAGVFCSSVASFVAPVLEELVFTGFGVGARRRGDVRVRLCVSVVWAEGSVVFDDEGGDVPEVLGIAGDQGVAVRHSRRGNQDVHVAGRPADLLEKTGDGPEDASRRIVEL